MQCLFRYKQILEDNLSDIADIVVEEHGKTKGEAIGSLRRGIDCIEFATAAPALMMGRTLPQIAVSTSFCRTEDEGGVGIWIRRSTGCRWACAWGSRRSTSR